ncbi:hypothetical protein LOC71_04370 [Rhodopirellula sp. JC740]|uniref:Integral membrane protein n=1 Tax=Rhodopirellula halodulae TaxID=2894198 RepID=A0ABS8ND70_9BACT|nr:hypothetical protein [Rhodopirellula sp. JC740]MCC9641496.1 hypothetical protein [Rhodopirellula sp. JC740]
MKQIAPVKRLIRPVVIFLCLWVTWSLLSKAEEDAAVVVHLQDSELTESSGLVFSKKDPSCVWSHNDSGDRARLFAFDHRTGQRTGVWELESVDAIDWEDLAIVHQDADDDTVPSKLVVADCGDNLGRRDDVQLWWMDEMDPRNSGTVLRQQLHSIRVTYPDGAHDCEAIWYDPSSRSLMLLCKRSIPWVGLYRVPIDLDAGPPSSKVEAELLVRVPIAMATAADRDSSTGDVWVCTYWQAFRFPSKDGMDLVGQMSQTPSAIELRSLRQVEALAVCSDSSVWVSSEGEPAPLVKITPAK